MQKTDSKYLSRLSFLHLQFLFTLMFYAIISSFKEYKDGQESVIAES